LFPLELVALPHELIPLHIFKERFKTMMNESRAQKDLVAVYGTPPRTRAPSSSSPRSGLT